MTNQPQPQRPKVRGTIILTVILAVLQIVVGTLDLSDPQAASGAAFNIGFGILLIVVAVLIALYKRLGLILGLVAYGFMLVGYALAIASGGSFDVISLLTVILVVAALFYLYRYLTRTPEKQFFT